MAGELNPNQLRFCQLYLETGNATQSYLDAGYKAKNADVAGTLAARLLGNDRVRAYISAERDRLRQSGKVKLDDLLAKNAEIAFSNMDDVVFVEDGRLQIKDGVSLNQFDGVGATYTVSESRSEKMDSKGGSASSESTSETKSFTLKRPDRLKALDQLAKLIGAYDSDKDPSGTTLASSAERVLAALAGLRKK